MAKRKTDTAAPPPQDTELMAVVEATDPNPAPEDAAQEPAALPPTAEPPAPPAPAPPPTGARSFLALVLGGAVAAACGFALARLMPDSASAPPDGALVATVQQQAQELAALREQLAALSENPGVDPAIEDRVAALESAAAPDLTMIEGRLDAVQSQLAALGGNTEPAAILAELAALRTRVDELGAGGTVPADVTAAAAAAESRLQDAESRAAALAQQVTEAAAAARRAAAMDRIAAALDSGAPFAAALRDLGDAVPAALADHAAGGVPTLPELQDSFAPAARESLESALRANMGESWTARLSNFLRSQTGLRSLAPREGDDPDAILSRAEAALAAGDLQAALRELDALPEPGKPALQDWIAAANQRIAAVAAFSALPAN